MSDVGPRRAPPEWERASRSAVDEDQAHDEVYYDALDGGDGGDGDDAAAHEHVIAMPPGSQPGAANPEAIPGPADYLKTTANLAGALGTLVSSVGWILIRKNSLIQPIGQSLASALKNGVNAIDDYYRGNRVKAAGQTAATAGFLTGMAGTIAVSKTSKVALTGIRSAGSALNAAGMTVLGALDRRRGANLRAGGSFAGAALNVMASIGYSIEAAQGNAAAFVALEGAGAFQNTTAPLAGAVDEAAKSKVSFPWLRDPKVVAQGLTHLGFALNATASLLNKLYSTRDKETGGSESTQYTPLISALGATGMFLASTGGLVSAYLELPKRPARAASAMGDVHEPLLEPPAADDEAHDEAHDEVYHDASDADHADHVIAMPESPHRATVTDAAPAAADYLPAIASLASSLGTLVSGVGWILIRKNSLIQPIGQSLASALKYGISVAADYHHKHPAKAGAHAAASAGLLTGMAGTIASHKPTKAAGYALNAAGMAALGVLYKKKGHPAHAGGYLAGATLGLMSSIGYAIEAVHGNTTAILALQGAGAFYNTAVPLASAVDEAARSKVKLPWLRDPKVVAQGLTHVGFSLNAIAALLNNLYSTRDKETGGSASTQYAPLISALGATGMFLASAGGLVSVYLERPRRSSAAASELEMPLLEFPPSASGAEDRHASPGYNPPREHDVVAPDLASDPDAQDARARAKIEDVQHRVGTELGFYEQLARVIAQEATAGRLQLSSTDRQRLDKLNQQLAQISQQVHRPIVGTDLGSLRLATRLAAEMALAKCPGDELLDAHASVILPAVRDINTLNFLVQNRVTRLASGYDQHLAEERRSASASSSGGAADGALKENWRATVTGLRKDATSARAETRTQSEMLRLLGVAMVSEARAEDNRLPERVRSRFSTKEATERRTARAAAERRDAIEAGFGDYYEATTDRSALDLKVKPETIGNLPTRELRSRVELEMAAMNPTFVGRAARAAEFVNPGFTQGSSRLDPADVASSSAPAPRDRMLQAGIGADHASKLNDLKFSLNRDAREAIDAQSEKSNSWFNPSADLTRQKIELLSRTVDVIVRCESAEEMRQVIREAQQQHGDLCREWHRSSAGATADTLARWADAVERFSA